MRRPLRHSAINCSAWRGIGEGFSRFLRSWPSSSCKTLVGYKDVLAHLDGTEEDEIRLRYAEAIAAIFGARLAGIFTNGLPDIASYGFPPGAMASMELEQRLREDGEATHRRLADRFDQLSVANELRKIEETPMELRRAVTTEARCADLFVASCPRGAGMGKWACTDRGSVIRGRSRPHFASRAVQVAGGNRHGDHRMGQRA